MRPSNLLTKKKGFSFCSIENQLENTLEENSVSMKYVGQTFDVLEPARICSGSRFLHW